VSERASALHLEFAAAELRELIARLLPDDDGPEGAAFLFARRQAAARDPDAYRVIQMAYVDSCDLATEDFGLLQLHEGVLDRLIREAHRLGAALVEAHSHPFDHSSRICFSPIDRRGLETLAPHVVWRLRGRPYIALVFGRRAFDGLYWSERRASPTGPVSLHTECEAHRPTGLSFEQWREPNGPF
jgi:hypothetical protein